MLTVIYTHLLILPMAQVDPRDAGLKLLLQLAPQTASVGFAAQPWFGTVPVSPYFSMPRPGGWRLTASPELKRRIVYDGKGWDADALGSQRPDFVVLTEYDYDDALRLKDPGVNRYLSVLWQNYQECDGTARFTLDPISIVGHLPTSVGAMPTHGLPHDMLYTNPYIFIYQRKPAQTP